MATISDIAKKTNVSIATVSRVLNYDKSLAISEHKRQRILETAEKLNYVPPKRKAALRTKPVKIGLVHWYTMAQELEDPYYLSIRMGVEQECYKKDIELVKFFRDNQLTDAGLNHGLDGVIAIGKFSPEEVKILAKKVNHVVFVDSSPDDTLYDSVVIDFHSASSQALHYLSQCGFEKIGFIGGRESIGKQRVPIQDPREYEYLSYVKSHNAYHPNYIKMGAFTIESGYQLMHEMIKDGQLPEAIWVASDAMAIGAIKACHEKGIHVPNTLSLIGFNDNPQSEFLIPRLSTIRVYKEFMGSLAMELLLERILKERRICKKVIIPTQLVVRESVKPKTPHKEEEL